MRIELLKKIKRIETLTITDILRKSFLTRSKWEVVSGVLLKILFQKNLIDRISFFNVKKERTLVTNTACSMFRIPCVI